MKVKDLIVKLKTFSADAQVLVQGYEDGYDSIKIVNEIIVTSNLSAADYNGEYEESAKGSKGSTPAVVIMGNRR